VGGEDEEDKELDRLVAEVLLLLKEDAEWAVWVLSCCQNAVGKVM
jgi:hypothetical protein